MKSKQLVQKTPCRAEEQLYTMVSAKDSHTLYNAICDYTEGVAIKMDPVAAGNVLEFAEKRMENGIFFIWKTVAWIWGRDKCTLVMRRLDIATRSAS